MSPHAPGPGRYGALPRYPYGVPGVCHVTAQHCLEPLRTGTSKFLYVSVVTEDLCPFSQNKNRVLVIFPAHIVRFPPSARWMHDAWLTFIHLTIAPGGPIWTAVPRYCVIREV